uniref:Uncharacterized protein n=1 Tax=Psilocybe cubensis TaxID=181762 RepID=A0A8H7Y6S7_PSICU
MMDLGKSSSMSLGSISGVQNTISLADNDREVRVGNVLVPASSTTQVQGSGNVETTHNRNVTQYINVAHFYSPVINEVNDSKVHGEPTASGKGLAQNIIKEIKHESESSIDEQKRNVKNPTIISEYTRVSDYSNISRKSKSNPNSEPEHAVRMTKAQIKFPKVIEKNIRTYMLSRMGAATSDFNSPYTIFLWNPYHNLKKAKEMQERNSTFTFESISTPKHPGGGILVLPKGCSKHSLSDRLMNVGSNLRNGYLATFVDSWYEPDNYEDGAPVYENGSLALIHTSYYQTNVWSAAVLRQKKHRPGQSYAKLTCIDPGAQIYSWEWDSHSMETNIADGIMTDEDDATTSREVSEDEGDYPAATTNPYKSLLDDTSFARCHKTTIPRGKAETFTRAMLMLGHGTPIWENPKVGDKIGISIGDVGMLSSNGYFEYCFNIFQPPTHPLQLNCPKNLEQLSPYPEASDIATTSMYFPPGTALTSKGVEMERHSNLPLDITFTVKAREGAIMVLPNGASRQDLISTTHIRDYIRKHALEWYSFFNDPSSILCPNGSLYVITGVDTSDAWGVACWPHLHTDTGNVAKIRYKPTEKRSWQNVDQMACRSSGGTDSKMAGSTHFIRGIKIAVNESAWIRHVLCDTPPSAIPFYHVLTVPTTGLRAQVQTYLDKKLRDPEKRKAMPTHVLFHPLDIILRYILAEVPTTEVALVDEGLWSSVADQSDGTVANITRLLIKIIEQHEIELGDGWTSLRPRAPSNDSKDTRKATWPSILMGAPARMKDAWCDKARSRIISRKVRMLFPGTPLTYEQLHVNSLTS